MREGALVQVVMSRPGRTIGSVDALALIGLVGLLIARFVPVARLIPFWGCTFRKMTGYPCPGCGLTRAADRFAHFNVLGALKANPLGTLAASAFLLCIVGSAVHLTFATPMPEVLLTDAEWRRLKWAGALLVVLNYGFVVYAHRVLHFT